MKLYYHPLSGHAHRAHLFLSLIGVAHELVPVDLAAGAHKAPDFLKLNRFGQVPVLDDDGTIVSDSNAILVYLAKKHRKTDWLPEDAGSRRGGAALAVGRGRVRSPSARRPRASSPCSGRQVQRRGSHRPRACHPQADRCRAGRPAVDRRAESDHRRCRALQLHRPRAGGQCRPLRLSQRHRLARPHRSAAGLRRVPEVASRARRLTLSCGGNGPCRMLQPGLRPLPGTPAKSRCSAALGVAEKMAARGRVVLRDHLIDQHRDFFRSCPSSWPARSTAAGDAWATILAGQPGFMHSPDPASLQHRRRARSARPGRCRPERRRLRSACSASNCTRAGATA